MPRFLYIFASLFLLISLKGTREEDLLDKGSNVIHERTPKLDSLVDLLKKDSTAVILHIGDSHIEMRSFSEGICEAFRNEGINISKGWFLPAGIFHDLYDADFEVTRQSHAFRTDNIRTSAPELRLGITGRTFALEEKENTICITAAEAITELEILHDSRSDLQIKPVGKKHKKSTVILQEAYQKPVGLNGSGLTITKIKLPVACRKFELRFTKKESQRVNFYAFRISKSRVQYSNFGVSGGKYEHFVMSRDLQKQAEALKPSLVIVTLGTNDCYQSNLDTTAFQLKIELLVQSIRAAAPGAEFVFMTAPDTKYKGSKPLHIHFVNRSIREVCKKHHLPYWDWNAVMGGENSIQNWENSPYAYGDYLHFSKEAYRMFGLAFTHALLRIGE
ncbi:MAG: GDSL-type esterase/lipase family protein [Bacteroidota bacterium]